MVNLNLENEMNKLKSLINGVNKKLSDIPADEYELYQTVEDAYRLLEEAESKLLELH